MSIGNVMREYYLAALMVLFQEFELYMVLQVPNYA